MKFLEYSDNHLNKLNSEFWGEFRIDSNYFQKGEIYQHLLNGKFHCYGKLIDKTDKLIDVMLDKEAYLILGMNKKAAINYVREKFGNGYYKNSRHYRTKIDFKIQKIAVLIFQKIEIKEAEQLNLNLLTNKKEF